MQDKEVIEILMRMEILDRIIFLNSRGKNSQRCSPPRRSRRDELSQVFITTRYSIMGTYDKY